MKKKYTGAIIVFIITYALFSLSHRQGMERCPSQT